MLFHHGRKEFQLHFREFILTGSGKEADCSSVFMVCAFLTFDRVCGIIRENHPIYVGVGGSDDGV